MRSMPGFVRGFITSIFGYEFKLPAIRRDAILFAILFSTILCGSSSHAAAQSQGSVPPGRAARDLITRPIDDARRTVLRGNRHPLARAEFDRGTAPAGLPMQRMLLVLQRSDEQESALKAVT